MQMHEEIVMKKRRFTEAQGIAVLRHAEGMALVNGMDWKRGRSVPVKPPEIVG